MAKATTDIWFAALLCISAPSACIRAGFAPAAPEQDARRRTDSADSGHDSGAIACLTEPDDDTLVLLGFNGSGAVARDESRNDHSGTVVGPSATRVATSECGQALSLSPSDPISHVRIDTSTDFDLDVGAVDFWVRPAAFDQECSGLVARDAWGLATDGHFLILLLADGGVAARLQRPAGGVWRCSEPVTLDHWHHVRVAFGPGGFMLHVDGVVAQRKETLSCGTVSPDPVRCGEGASDEGIAGNANPWVIGAASWYSPEGTTDALRAPLDGLIDAVQISRSRRD